MSSSANSSKKAQSEVSSSETQSSQNQSTLQKSQTSHPKKLALQPIISSFARKMIAQKEDEERLERTMMDDEKLRESLDKLKTGRFTEGASTADGELSIDTQECMPIKWYKDNAKTVWVILVPDDLTTPSKDIAPRQGIFAKAIKDAIHDSMLKNPKVFGKWFSSKGQILSPVSVDVNNSNPNDITAIFCPPNGLQFPNLIDQIKVLEAVIPIPYKPDAKPKKPGVFLISFSEVNPFDDVTVFAFSFQVTFNAESVRKNFSLAADIITSYFESKEILLSSPDFVLTLPHPTKDDDKTSKGRTLPAKILITYNAPDLPNLERIALNVGRLHGINVDIPESIAKIPNFSIRTHCRIFDNRVETERPIWTKGIIETLHTEAQKKAAENVDSVLKLLFCHHYIGERGATLTDIRLMLKLSEQDNATLTDEILLIKIQLLISDKTIQVSPHDSSLYSLSPIRRKWRSLKLILPNNTALKLQQRDLGIHLSFPFGLPPDQPVVSFACFYLTTSNAVLASYSNTASFNTYDLWKYMTNRFKQYKAFFEATPQSVIASYSEALERTGSIEAEWMTPTFLLQYASDCAEAARRDAFVNPLAASCLAFPAEFKKFEWLFLQMRDNIEARNSEDIISSLEHVYHIKSANKEAKTIFIKYVGSFSSGESMGHFISLNVPARQCEEFKTKIVSSITGFRYISVHSSWPPNLLEKFPIKEAEHLVYESLVSEIVEIDSSQSQVVHSEVDSHRPVTPDEGTCEGGQAAYDEEEQALTNTLENLELINTRLSIAYSRLGNSLTLDCSKWGCEFLTRRIDELCILSKEISSHMQHALDLKPLFPPASTENADDVNPFRTLEIMDIEAQKKLHVLEGLIDKLKTQLSGMPAAPETVVKHRPEPTPISNCLLRIRSSFVVDSIASDLELDPTTRRLRLFETFWVFPTRNTNLSLYHSVLLAASQPSVREKLLQRERNHFGYILGKEVTKEVVSLFEQVTKAMFLGFADCSIVSTSNITFNDYLERKQAKKNEWNVMPEDHFLCTPSLVAQTWQLNIMVLWKRRGLTRIFALPHGTIDSPVIPILFSADKSFLTPDGNPTITASLTTNRFYPLCVCEDKADSWETTFTAEPTVPESAQSTLTPIITAKFVKKKDKEFAFQAPVMVDGLGKDGQEVSEDEASELTIDGLSQQSQLLMDAFINDQSDEDSAGPPSFNPILEQVDKEMALRKLTETNLLMFKQIRKRKILDDDDEDVEVPCIRIERQPHPTAQPAQTPLPTTSTSPTSAPGSNRNAPPSRGKPPSIPPERPRRTNIPIPPNGRNAAATTGSAGRGSSK